MIVFGCLRINLVIQVMVQNRSFQTAVKLVYVAKHFTHSKECQTLHRHIVTLSDTVYKQC